MPQIDDILGHSVMLTSIMTKKLNHLIPYKGKRGFRHCPHCLSWSLTNCMAKHQSCMLNRYWLLISIVVSAIIYIGKGI